jgi:UPF0176 protein
MAAYTNISAYRFVPLTELKALKQDLLSLCRNEGLKGTILLSTEGINLFVAGTSESIQCLVGFIRKLPGLSDLVPKESVSEHQPFNRMLVRIKKEIIAFGVAGIDPSRHTAPKLPPKELKAWLDAGKEVVLLDTRNDYEIKLGSFSGALPIGVRHFRDFPAAVQKLPLDLKQKPIVMFCTGGIRCEKAGPYMQSQGFEQVFQLDGGILKYFEECGSAHYSGDCFVFDQRVGVDPSLQETPNSQCFVCLTPLTAEEASDARYVLGKSCPYCFKTDSERTQSAIAQRNQILAQVTSPLPGSTPYLHYRPLAVPARFDGARLDAFLSGILPHVPASQWAQDFADRRFVSESKQPLTEDTLVYQGQRVLYETPEQVEPEVSTDVRILYEDEALIVLRKPAPLPVHPSGRFNRNTLKHFLDLAYAPQKPHQAHRLDANTTGILLAARTKHFASLLQPLFATGEVEKKYVALVHGHPSTDVFECRLAISEQTRETGSRFVSDDGMPCLTRFRVLRRYEDNTTLVEAVPVTGRTNQIRVHLWELGNPIVGDQMYLPGKQLGQVQTHAVSDRPLCLHALGLRFRHPIKKEPMQFWDPDFGVDGKAWGKELPESLRD